MSNAQPKRRFVLKSLAGSLGLPALGSLRATGGPVQQNVITTTAAPIQRFVAIGNLLGFQQKSLFPDFGGDHATAGEGIAERLRSTTLLRPLQENFDRLRVYRGLDHGIHGGHFAVHTFLSGVLHHESKSRPDRNVTIDQYLADAIGRRTRFASLAVGSEGGIHGGCQLSWTKSGVRVPPITGPADLFDRLFVSDSPEQRQRRDRQQDLQGSILDSMNHQARWLSDRVNHEDRVKLDEYFSSIRDVETRLQSRRRWANEPKPNPPMSRPSDTNTVEDLPLLYELIALALQTDCTRIATLEIGGSFLPHHLGIHKSYHSLSHHGNKEESLADLITLETYQIKQFNGFLNRLRSIPDSDGSLLDSTAVLFGSGMGNGNSHKNSDLPILLAGGGYGDGTFRSVRSKGIGKVPLCNLYVDLAQRMGVRIDSFGNSTGSFA